jgi:hypothetical protein
VARLKELTGTWPHRGGTRPYAGVAAAYTHTLFSTNN